MFKLLVLSVGTLGPLAIWAGVSGAVKWRLFSPHSMFRLLRIWHWVSWVTALVLWLCYLLPSHVHWLYAGAASTFSAGLVFPESWLKSQLAPSESSSMLSR
jgi:hypothetical protein